MSERVSARDLRVGDDEREHVLGLLQKAVGRGLLDIDEFTARADAVLAATSRGQLNAVLVDLPGMEAAPERMELVGSSAAEIRRKGDWTVPRELVLRNKWNVTTVDFTAARCPYREVLIVLDITGGPVELRVPAGAGVSVVDLKTTWGGMVEDTRREQHHFGRPRFVVTGTVRFAPLTIRGPRNDG